MFDTMSAKKQTVLSIIFSIIVFFFPMHLVANLIIEIYKIFNQLGSSSESGDSLIPFLRGALMLFWDYLLPGLLSGGLPIYLALLAANKIFRSANEKTVFKYTVSILAVILTLILCAAVFFAKIDEKFIEYGFYLVGFGVGSWMYFSQINE